MAHTPRETFGNWFGVWCVIALFTLVVTTGIYDHGGRQAWNHSKPVPVGAVKLSDRAYLIQSRTLTANDVCLGISGGSDNERVETTSSISQLNGALYVECGQAQTWNDSRRGSVNFGRALIHQGTNPFVVGPLGALLALFMIPGTIHLMRRRKKAKTARELEEARLEAKHDSLEEKRAALAAAYARGEINEVEFEQSLDRIFDL